MTTGLIDANLQDVLVVFEEVPNVDLSVMCEQLQTARRELLNQLAGLAPTKPDTNSPLN